MGHKVAVQNTFISVIDESQPSLVLVSRTFSGPARLEYDCSVVQEESASPPVTPFPDVAPLYTPSAPTFSSFAANASTSAKAMEEDVFLDVADENDRDEST